MHDSLISVVTKNFINNLFDAAFPKANLPLYNSLRDHENLLVNKNYAVLMLFEASKGFTDEYVIHMVDARSLDDVGYAEFNLAYITTEGKIIEATGSIEYVIDGDNWLASHVNIPGITI